MVTCWPKILIFLTHIFVTYAAIPYARENISDPTPRNFAPTLRGKPAMVSDLTEAQPRLINRQRLDFNYHNYDQLTQFLRSMTAQYPDLLALYSIGKSVQGRDLWVMVVSSSPYEHILGKPDIKMIGNIHGNEAVGKELLMHLIEYLVEQYNNGDDFVKWMLDNTRIHILPSLNPDGYEVSKEGTCDGGQGRYNARGFDLNRNFPDYFKTNNKRTQPEAEAVKKWVSKIQFILSSSLHGGALVASYPFDNTPNSLFQAFGGAPSITPDDDVFRHLSLTYSKNHAKMARGVTCKQTARFQDGITNGAAWYPLTGGMQDYNYVWGGCMEVTLELSCCKFPPASELPKYWEDNRESLLKFMAEAHRGVQGFVMDENNNPIEDASLRVKSRDVGFKTTKYGEFWRILLPGVYKLEAYAEGYLPKEVEFVVIDAHPTLINVTLISTKKSDGYYRPHFLPGPMPAATHQSHQYYHGPSKGQYPAPPSSNILSSFSSGVSNMLTSFFG